MSLKVFLPATSLKHSQREAAIDHRVNFCFGKLQTGNSRLKTGLQLAAMAASKSVKERQGSAIIFFAALVVTFFLCSPALARVEAHFLYNLSDFSGMLPLYGGKLAV